MDTFLDYIAADFVDMNNTDAVYKIVKHFIQNGHLEIGLIKSSVQTRNFFLREKAYYQVMHDLGIPINNDYIFDVYSTFDGAYSDLMKILKRSNRTKFKKNMLQPLIDSGFLEMTEPDSPKSPKQKYRITKEGQEAIKGQIND